MIVLIRRLRTTVVSVFAIALTVMMRRQIEGFPDPAVLNVFNIATLFIVILLIVVIIKAWMPGR